MLKNTRLKKVKTLMSSLAFIALSTGQVHATQAIEEVSTPVQSINDSANQYPDASAVLDKLHLSATKADWDSYFSLYLPEAVFIGTDATEHWGMTEFEGYARPTDGWKYTPQSRVFVSVNTQHNDQVLMFDEILDSVSYGLSRGTGTLIKTKKGWKIAQYHLSFPIPNEIAKEITAKIKSEK